MTRVRRHLDPSPSREREREESIETGKAAAATAPTGYRTPQAEAETRAWIESVAARSSPPLESCIVPTRLGPTHVLRGGGGSGPERVCLPGWGTCSAFWAVAGQLGPLTRGAAVTLVDVPGQPGLSTGRALPGSAEDVGAWLGDVLDALEVDQIDLLGSSLGGLLAVRAARRLGARVRRLVLLAPAGFVWPLLRPRALGPTLRHWLQRTEDSAARFIDACLLGGIQPLDSGVRAELARALRRSAHAYGIRGLPPIRLGDHELRALDGNVLLVLGNEDPLFSARGTLARARRLLPRGLEQTVLPGHGHGIELSRDAMSAAGAFLDARGG